MWFIVASMRPLQYRAVNICRSKILRRDRPDSLQRPRWIAILIWRAWSIQRPVLLLRSFSVRRWWFRFLLSNKNCGWFIRNRRRRLGCCSSRLLGNIWWWSRFLRINRISRPLLRYVYCGWSILVRRCWLVCRFLRNRFLRPFRCRSLLGWIWLGRSLRGYRFVRRSLQRWIWLGRSFLGYGFVWWSL